MGNSPANDGKQFTVVLMPIADERWQSLGPFDLQSEATDWARANYDAGDERRWIVIPLDDPALYAAPADDRYPGESDAVYRKRKKLEQAVASKPAPADPFAGIPGAGS